MKQAPLKLSTEEIFFLELQLKEVYNISIQDFLQLDHEDKLTHSVMLDVYDRIATKKRTLERKAEALDTKKRYQITLKYHEEYLLLQFIMNLCYTNPHYTMLQRALIAKMDQNLK